LECVVYIRISEDLKIFRRKSYPSHSQVLPRIRIIMSSTNEIDIFSNAQLSAYFPLKLLPREEYRTVNKRTCISFYNNTAAAVGNEYRNRYIKLKWKTIRNISLLRTLPVEVDQCICLCTGSRTIFPTVNMNSCYLM
jgi:hypothetical protein